MIEEILSIPWEEVQFVRPWLLWFTALPLFAVVWKLWRETKRGTRLRVSATTPISGSHTIRTRMRYIPYTTRAIAIALLIVAVAQPQTADHGSTFDTEGIDIVLAIDVSGSMKAQDLKPDRLRAARDVAMKFTAARQNDRIGVVVFAGEAFTQCPLTIDRGIVQNLLQEVRGDVLVDGTAIGMGLATSIARLQNSDAKSKVVILLTDGSNNAGEISPETAAEIALQYDVRVYTIGVGKQGMAPFPMQDMFGNTVLRNMQVDIDEATLKDIASRTGGEYFRATNNSSLEDIYDRIDQLEKTTIEVTEYSNYTDHYAFLALMAAILLLFDSILRLTVLKSALRD